MLVQIYYVRKQISIGYSLKTARKYLIASGVMFLVCCLIKMDGVMSIILKMAVGGITYLLMLVILKDKYVYEVRDMLLKRLKK